MIPISFKKIDMQLIMPCYCSGASVDVPELRAASFRGELRWWFRCLGGNRRDEQAVFGGVNNDACASAVALIVYADPVEGKIIKYEPSSKETKNASYITYFLTQQGKKCIPPGYRFSLELRLRKNISPENEQLLALAWDCMCNLGAIGARKTRGLGAYAPVKPDEKKVELLMAHDTVKKYFSFTLSEPFGDFRSPQAPNTVLKACAVKLHDYRTKYGLYPAKNVKSVGMSAKGYYGPSVLGNASPGARQSSAIRFRPVLMADNKFCICTFKAPDITLGPEAKKHNIASL